MEDFAAISDQDVSLHLSFRSGVKGGVSRGLKKEDAKHPHADFATSVTKLRQSFRTPGSCESVSIQQLERKICFWRFNELKKRSGLSFITHHAEKRMQISAWQKVKMYLLAVRHNQSFSYDNMILGLWARPSHSAVTLSSSSPSIIMSQPLSLCLQLFLDVFADRYRHIVWVLPGQICLVFNIFLPILPSAFFPHSRCYLAHQR